MKRQLTFITGNQHKADYLARFLDEHVAHYKLDLDELQSLDPRTVIEHKVRQAYDVLKQPVLVEDSILTFTAMGRLPGTFIKWFENEMGVDGLAKLAHSLERPEAVGELRYALYDGGRMYLFEGEMRGRIAQEPRGSRGFGFDPIFINEGYDITRGEMTQEQYDTSSYRLQALKKLKSFLEKQN